MRTGVIRTPARLKAGPRNILLTGFMGSGKTTVGRRLARHLGWHFLDLDRDIERRAGSSVAGIFRTRGLTGWAAINGLRGNTSIEERVKYDLYYIENWSLWFDIKICIRTALEIFHHTTAY